MKTNLTATAFLLGFFIFNARAGSRSSANYALAVETADSGGHRSASASYSNDSSIGGIAGIGTVVSPAEIAKHGYIGQFYHVTRVTVMASPATINEAGTRQLGAIANLDDTSGLSLTGSQVAWSILSGPVVSISSGGLATAGIVYQDSPAVIRADFQQKFGTLGLIVLDTIPDNYGTYAGDGLPDWWQVQYFGENNPNAAPSADPDGDGQNNVFEYVAGTVPTNAASHFSLSISTVPNQPQQSMLTFAPRLTNRVYLVQFTTNLSSSLFAPLLTGSQTDIGTTRTVTDTNANEAAKFYRVNISLP